ncbi:hypothetical protein BDZ94DRAFT_459734 [Collybia nuda]|uniref:Uncharacterized protein n=1 Tax=Collybia nuda TaxID=64659 RepID=A0A9P5Y8L0_9AGAR|nr:hypothetical protein BDZ94DRAFT_459734 [Collybia nuda]
MRCTLTCRIAPLSTSGMVSHPVPKRPILQVRGPLLTSLASTPISWMSQGSSSLPQTSPSLSGSVPSGIVDSSPKQLRATSLLFVPSTLTKDFLSWPEHNPKHPISLSILQQLASSPGDLSNTFDASFDAAIKLAWSGFLCCGEFTINHGEKFNTILNLTRGCMTFVPSLDNPTHIRLDLPASKTDPFRKGVSILIAKAPDGFYLCCFCFAPSLHH